MWFDVQAALKEKEGCNVATSATSAIIEVKTPENPPSVADVADVATLHPARKFPDTDAFEERATIAEYDGGLTRDDAEQLAAQCLRYDNVIAFRAAQQSNLKGKKND